MKRKLTISLLIVVLVLCCVMAVACKHKHDFTEYRYDDNNHWKICVEDNEIDESTRAPHDFTNGDCVCGKEAPAPHVHSYTQWYKDDPANHWKVCPADGVKGDATVAPHNYGTTGVCECGRPEPLVEYNVEGVVVLRKLGSVTNSNDGVTLTLSDDEGDLPNDITLGENGKFSLKVYAGKYYITAAKNGFIDKKITVNVSKEFGDLVGGDALEIAMEYDAFYAGSHEGENWSGNYGDPSKIDKSHLNDVNPYFVINNGTNDFYQYSVDKYNDVEVSVTFKQNLTGNNPTVALVFDGHKAVMARIETIKDNGTPTGEFKVQWIGGGNGWEESNITNKWDFGNDEAHYNPINAELKAKYKDEGLELKLVRRGLIVSVYVEGKLADTQVLPSEYADQQCQVMFMVAGVNGGTEIHYNIGTDVAKTAIEITNPETENGSITVSGTHVGDNVVLTITPDEGCRLTSLKVNEQERIKDIREGKLVLGGYTADTLTINATFAQFTIVNVDVAVSGNKLGQTVDLNGQTLTLTDFMGEVYEVTVADGKLTKQIPDGTYTVTLSGYLPYELVVPKEGDIEDVVLAYVSFENMPFNQNWNNTIDLSLMNDGKFTTTNGNTVAVKSTETFGNVKLTLNALKGRGGKQGVWFLFPTANGYDAISITIKDSGAIEFDRTGWWQSDSGINNVTRGAKPSASEDGWYLADDDGKTMYQTLSAAEMEKYKAGTLELSVIRYGNYFYIYVDGNYTGNWCVVDEKYAETECYLGFVGIDTISGKEWNFDIAEVTSLPELNVELPETVEHGTVKFAAESYKLGDQVVLEITLDENYIVDSLTINGKEIKTRIKDNKVFFTPTSTDEIVVEITIIRVVYVNLDVAISGNKLGKTVDLSGKTVTLTDIFDKTVQLQVVDGKLIQSEFPAGTYTVTLDGYLAATLVVPEEGTAQAVVLNYESFENMAFSQNWGNRIDLSLMNDGKFTTTNGNTVAVKSTETFGNVKLTLNALKDRGEKQGVWFLFPTADGYDAISITIKDSGAIEFDQTNWWKGDSGINNITVSAKHENGWWLADDEGNGIYQSLSSAETALYQAGKFELSVIRYGNYFYIYLNGVYSGNWCVVDEKYADAECYLGFVGINTISGKEWNFDIEEVTALPELNVTLSETVANGKVEFDKEAYKLGDQVTLTLSVDDNCFIVALYVDGVDIKGRIKDNKVSFTPTSTDEITIEFVVEQIKDVTVSKEITGRKYGKDVSLNGLSATLTNKADAEITYTVQITDGVLTGEFKSGFYTLSVEGFLPIGVVIVEDGILEDIVLQFYAFYKGGPGWGSYDFSKQNEGQITMTNGYAWVYTKEKFDNVAFSMYLKADGYTGGNQGIALMFDGDVVAIRQENNVKIQFAAGFGFGDSYKVNIAEGHGWNDLMFFGRYPDLKKALNDGTLKLTVVREGNTIYAFINDVYFGKSVINAKYADKKCEVGIYFEGAGDGPNKTVKYVMEDFDTYRKSVTVQQTAENGSVTVNGENHKVGDTLTVLFAASEGYKLTSVTVNGTDVTSKLVSGDNGFTLTTIAKTQSLDIVATFVKADEVTVDITLSGKKYGTSDSVTVTATTATLKDLYNTYTLDIADGRIIKNIQAGVYTLSVEGFAPKTVVITADGLTGEIVLDYNIFTSDPDSADLSQIGEGKIIATGNGGVDLETKDTYVDVIVESKFDVHDYNSRRYGIALVFADGKNFRIDFAVQDSGNNILQQTNWGSVMFDWQWVDFPEGYFAQGSNSYTRDEIENEFMVKGLTYKLEREGETVKLYINNVLMKTYTLPDEYASQEAKLKFIFDSNGTDGTAEITFDITVPATVE